MLRIKRRIIPLALAADGIRVQMLAHQVHAVHILPFGDALEFFRRHVPARTGKRLGQHLLFTKLLRGGRDLTRGQLRADLPSQPVHPRNALILVKRHHARATPHLCIKLAFLDRVTGQAAVVRQTPAVNAAHEVFGIEYIHQPPVAEAETGCFFAVHKQRAQQIKNICAVGFFVLCQQHRRVGCLIAKILRLIGEEARNALAEFRTEAFKILLVRQSKKRIRDARVKDIDRGGILAVVDAEIL